MKKKNHNSTAANTSQALRLDLQESDQPCGLAKLKINGQSIPQNATGGGTGSFTILDGSIITASWNILCHDDEKQFMEMNIHSVNGRALAHTRFSTSFYQTAPVVIKNIDNVVKVKYVHLKTTETERVFDKEDANTNGGESDKAPPHDFDLDAQVSALQDLRGEERELRRLIMDKENAIMDHLVSDDIEPDSDDAELPIPLRKCNDLACAFKSLAYEMRHAHGQLCEDARGWRAFFGCAHGKATSNDDSETYESLDNIGIVVDDEWYIDDFVVDDSEDDLDYHGYIAEHYRSSVSCAQYPRGFSFTLTLAADSHSSHHALCRNNPHLWRSSLFHHCRHPPLRHPSPPGAFSSSLRREL